MSLTTSADAGDSVEGVPCSMAAIISQHCTSCHAARPRGGAPMPLMTLADFHAPARADTSASVAYVAQYRILPTSDAQVMPPSAANDPLTMIEKILLVHWFSSGAYGSADACPINEPH